MELESIQVSEIRQRQKHKYQMISLIVDLWESNKEKVVSNNNNPLVLMTKVWSSVRLKGAEGMKRREWKDYMSIDESDGALIIYQNLNVTSW